MGLEVATYINGLIATNPTGTDAQAQGDDHIRLLKSVLLNTFPNLTGAVTPTQTELNYVDGVTSSIQNQIDGKLGTSAKAADSTLFDGQSLSAFLRHSISNTASAVTSILMNGVASPTYANGHLELRTSDTNEVSVGFHRQGATACQLRHASNGLILSGSTRTNAADFYAYGNVTAYSDIRFKTNIKVITEALEKVQQLNGYTFERTNADEGQEGIRQAGVIAQEVEKVLPEVVKTDAEGYKSVAYGNIVALLIEAVKELSEQVEALKNGSSS